MIATRPLGVTERRSTSRHRGFPLLAIALLLSLVSVPASFGQPSAPVFLTQPPATTSEPPLWRWTSGRGAASYVIWPEWETAPIPLSPYEREYRAPANLKPGLHWVNLAAVDGSGRWSGWSTSVFTLAEGSTAILERSVGSLRLNDSPWCTGTLVGEDLFLTAGHCLYDSFFHDLFPVSALSVRFEYVKGGGGDQPNLVYPVNAILESWPGGPGPDFDRDLALLRLARAPRSGSGDAPGVRFGYLPMNPRTTELGETLHAVHHGSSHFQQPYEGVVTLVNPNPTTFDTGFVAGIPFTGGASGSALVDAAGRVVGVAAHADELQQSLHRLGFWRHVHGIGGKCLAAQNGSAANGTPVVLEDCIPGEASQLWNLVDSQLANQNGGCATQLGAFFTNGTPIQLFDCSPPRDHQKYWDSGKNLRSRFVGRCLTTLGMSSDPGTPIVLFDCVPGATNQEWSFLFPSEL